MVWCGQLVRTIYIGCCEFIGSHYCSTSCSASREPLCLKPNFSLWLGVIATTCDTKVRHWLWVMFMVSYQLTCISLVSSCRNLGYYNSCVFFLDPQWASSTLGVFLCVTCCGIHRNISDISKVKSLSMAKWEEDQIEVTCLLFMLSGPCQKIYTYTNKLHYLKRLFNGFISVVE